MQALEGAHLPSFSDKGRRGGGVGGVGEVLFTGGARLRGQGLHSCCLGTFIYFRTDLETEEAS